MCTIHFKFNLVTGLPRYLKFDNLGSSKKPGISKMKINFFYFSFSFLPSKIKKRIYEKKI